MSHACAAKCERVIDRGSQRVKRNRQFVVDSIGWYGMAAVLLAYGFVSLEILPSHSLVCILLNLTGSAGLVMAAFVKRAHQFVVINIVWGLVALLTLVQLLST